MRIVSHISRDSSQCPHVNGIELSKPPARHGKRVYAIQQSGQNKRAEEVKFEPYTYFGRPKNLASNGTVCTNRFRASVLHFVHVSATDGRDATYMLVFVDYYDILS